MRLTATRPLSTPQEDPMAKNKKDRTPKSSAAERGTQQAKSQSMEAQAEHRVSQLTPTDVAHKGRQKRFGHN
ncbi:hypothetical protein NX801_12280 [Streptomyces sp. LP05-1]|uniref:Uncharacterized protein n=1 Tax=Streptomyces pyxinae TaxID=2970734 RepID=A0ABT2CIH3_9ACTN|nr:hypothetical protein [Streptomyces sp. LP05-1]MCS0636424.1 hypothetical protein [Streptomyces sp. LP05-1]